MKKNTVKIPQSKEKTAIPSMQELTDYLNQQSKSVNKSMIAKHFKIKGDNRRDLNKLLRELKKKGILTRPSASSRKMAITGRLPDYTQIEITGVDSMGDLVARPLEWQSAKIMPQITVVQNKLNPPAGVGDIVQAKLRHIGKNYYEASLIRRIANKDSQVLGVYVSGFVRAVDKRLKQTFIMPDVPQEVKDNDLVIVDIPMIKSREPVARFVQRLGSATDAFAATQIAIAMQHLPVEFSPLTLKEVQHLKVPDLDEKRQDLRSVPFVTIDGEDARDFDDAVWAEKEENGYHIMVAIADVAYYVKDETALDKDAYLRGNSVYFPDRVIPMLPFELSNGVCSLNPNEDRAALVCDIFLDKSGVKKKHRFLRALIRSARRLTYPQVQDAMDKKIQITGLEKELQALQEAYLVLKKQRQKRGVIEIDVPEQVVVVNDKGKVVKIAPRVQTESMKLIEELMILANVSAAETLEEKGVPTMYRVHESPSEEKLKNLNLFLAGLGLHHKAFTSDSMPKDFNNLLVKSATDSKKFAINEFVLRSQSQACYSCENLGHFGLALERYAHFTSPIRRYADLMVHRALIKALKLGTGALTKNQEETFSETATHISQTERQAAGAEQEAQDRYTAQFLATKINQTFSAQISSVTPFGLFVRIHEYGAEGLVPVRSLSGDYYDYDEEKQILEGRNTGQKWQTGMMVKVVLKEALPITGGLMFHIKQR